MKLHCSFFALFLAAGCGDGNGADSSTDPLGNGEGDAGSGSTLSPGCGAPEWPEEGARQIDVDGMMRDYIIALPEGYDPNEPYRLVFVWHPLGGTAEGIATSGYMGFEPLSMGSAIFVAGQGLMTPIGNGWTNNGPDAAFARALVEFVSANYCVDKTRIFSTGCSFGGIMSNIVGCQLGDVIRAIAPIKGGGPDVVTGPACIGEAAAWITHGSADRIVAYDQGLGSRDYWAAANGCTGEPVPTGVENCVEYQGCRADLPVVWCPTDLGHVTPLFAVEEIWKFFNRF